MPLHFISKINPSKSNIYGYIKKISKLHSMDSNSEVVTIIRSYEDFMPYCKFQKEELQDTYQIPLHGTYSYLSFRSWEILAVSFWKTYSKLSTWLSLILQIINGFVIAATYLLYIQVSRLNNSRSVLTTRRGP